MRDRLGNKTSRLKKTLTLDELRILACSGLTLAKIFEDEAISLAWEQ
jgi:hypothetical protein